MPRDMSDADERREVALQELLDSQYGDDQDAAEDKLRDALFEE
jgi:hypothetical protein